MTRFLEWWYPSLARIALFTLVAYDGLCEYMKRDPGIFGTVWEHLIIAIIALHAVWEGLEVRAAAREVGR